MYAQQQIQQPCQEKPKMAPATLPTRAGNASTVLPASLLNAAASLFNHLFKTPSSFGGDPPPPPPPPPPPLRTHVMASTIVEIVIERAVSI